MNVGSSAPALRVVSRKPPADDEERDASRSQCEHDPQLVARGHEHGPRDEYQAEELKCSADEVERPSDPDSHFSPAWWDESRLQYAL